MNVKGLSGTLNYRIESTLGKALWGTWWLGLGNFIFLAGGFFINSLLGRILGPGEYGLFAFLSYLVVLLNLLILSPLPDALSRTIAARGRLESGFARFGVPFQIFLGLLFALGFWVTAPLLAAMFKDMALVPLFRIISISFIPTSLGRLYFFFFVGLKDYKKQTIILCTDALSRVFLISGLVLLGYGIQGAIWGITMASVVNLIIIILYLTPSPSPDSGDRAENSLGLAGIIFLSSVFILLINNLDLIMIKVYVSDSRMVGYYGSAFTIARLSQMVLFPFTLTLYPIVAKAYSDKDTVRAGHCVKNYLGITILLLAFICAGLVVFKKPIYLITYGRQYFQAFNVFTLLVLARALLGLSLMLSSVLLSLSKPYLAACIGLFLTVLDLVLLFFLIPVLGMKGAAYATLVTALVGFIVLGLTVFGILRPGKNMYKGNVINVQINQ